MKASTSFLSIGIVLIIVPIILIRLSLAHKIKNNLFSHHSSKTNLNTAGINEIHLKNVEKFYYEFNSDSTSLEIVSKSLHDTLTVVRQDSILKFVSEKSFDSTDAKKNQSYYSSLKLFSTNEDNDIQKYVYQQYYKAIDICIVKFKGPQLPKIVAENSLIYIDSVSRNSSFEFDLDFSVVYWHNYDKSHRYTNKNDTHRWQMKSMKIALKNGSYYFNKNLAFDHLDLLATRRTDLHLEGYNYNNVKFQIDSTVRVDAPYSIWKILKVIEIK